MGVPLQLQRGQILTMQVFRDIIFAAPDWSKDDLVEEIVVQVLGCCEAHPLHSEGCDEAKDNPGSGEDAEDSYMVSLME